jgi:hypothetical protein
MQESKLQDNTTDVIQFSSQQNTIQYYSLIFESPPRNFVIKIPLPGTPAAVPRGKHLSILIVEETG